MKNDKTIRSFIAVSLNQDIRERIRNIQNEFKNILKSRAFKWVNPDAVHITLKFLGTISRDEAENIINDLSSQITTERFSLTFSGFGCFPSNSKPRVLWIGINPEPALTNLQNVIEDRMGILSFPKEDKPFKPHLTLARAGDKEKLKFTEEEIILLKSIAKKFMSNAILNVNSVKLYQSHLSPGGAQYTVLHMFPLK